MKTECQRTLSLDELTHIVRECDIGASLSSLGYVGSTRAGAIDISGNRSSYMRLAVYHVAADFVVSDLRLRLNDASNPTYVAGVAALKSSLERENVRFECDFDIEEARAKALSYAMRLYDASVKL